MRLLCTFENEGQGQDFSRLLTKEGIAHECDVQAVSDWGSEAYGNRYCRIWIVEEDQLARAETLYEEYLANPEDPRFTDKPNLIQHILEPEEQKAAAKRSLLKIQKAASTWQSQPVGPVTLFLLVLCTLIFVWGSPLISPKSLPKDIAPVVSIATSPADRALLYDYPKAYEILDKFVSLYRIQNSDEQDQTKAAPQLPPEGQYLLNQYRQTPIWTGLYDKIVFALQDKWNLISFQQPMFEKIRQGELWRLASPVLLHYDVIHLFFNMIWLLILGKQIEHRIGGARYILFILISAIPTNTAQYLMSGPNFVGISGVICAMLGFIYMRQKSAPWEGYQLQRVTLVFLSFFILAMLGVQVASFLSEVYWNAPLAPRIANTAHLTGVAVGLALGKLDYFAWKKG